MSKLFDKAVESLVRSESSSGGEAYRDVGRAAVYAILAFVDELRIYNDYHIGIPKRVRDRDDIEIAKDLDNNRS
jgi:hypothetical protein